MFRDPDGIDYQTRFVVTSRDELSPGVPRTPRLTCKTCSKASSLLTTEQRNARIIAALRAANPHVKNFSHDEGLPTKPVGHQDGIRTSTRILRSYRNSHRRGSQFVEPGEVIEVLRDAGIEDFMLMGLYGYVGYMPQPRATQDVDILISSASVETGIRAISKRWPQLQVQRTEVVIRFRDPGEVSIDGEMKQVIDLMLPSDACYQAILKSHRRIDAATGHPIPTIEAACVSKFSAMISPFRLFVRKQQDAIDLRNLLKTNVGQINEDKLRDIAELTYPGGGDEILDYLRLALDDKPFPV